MGQLYGRFCDTYPIYYEYLGGEFFFLNDTTATVNELTLNHCSDR